jgi:hypothetical protein
MMAFRKRDVPKISSDQARRQGQITHTAFLLLGRERAIEFLNGDNLSLGGRPIELAIASEEGCAGVEGELARITLR